MLGYNRIIIKKQQRLKIDKMRDKNRDKNYTGENEERRSEDVLLGKRE